MRASERVSGSGCGTGPLHVPAALRCGVALHCDVAPMVVSE